MSRNPICPFAEVRLSPNGGFMAGGRPVVLDPKAFVPHSAASQLDADPPDRFFNPRPPAPEKPTVTHFWFYDSGKILQMKGLDVPAWGNGTLDRADGPTSPLAIVRDWYRTGRNPNLDTISAEFAGRRVIGADAKASEPTEAQVESFRRVADWMKAEGWLTLGPENVVLHRQISATECPDGRFDSAFLLGKLEDTLSAQDMERLARLERIVAAWGIDVPTTDGTMQRIQGEEALAFLDEVVNASAFRTLNNLNDALLQVKRAIESGVLDNDRVAMQDALASADAMLSDINNRVDR